MAVEHIKDTCIGIVAEVNDGLTQLHERDTVYSGFTAFLAEFQGRVEQFTGALGGEWANKLDSTNSLGVYDSVEEKLAVMDSTNPELQQASADIKAADGHAWRDVCEVGLPWIDRSPLAKLQETAQLFSTAIGELAAKAAASPSTVAGSESAQAASNYKSGIAHIESYTSRLG